MSKKTFQTIDSQTLMGITLDTPRFIVPSLIPTGLHIIGGSPKVGKSWLMLWLCLNVSKGKCLWDYQCRKGIILYLCLEDSYDRSQSRLLDITDDALSNLFFSIMPESIGSGLSDQKGACRGGGAWQGGREHQQYHSATNALHPHRQQAAAGFYTDDVTTKGEPYERKYHHPNII